MSSEPLTSCWSLPSWSSHGTGTPRPPSSVLPSLSSASFWRRSVGSIWAITGPVMQWRRCHCHLSCSVQSLQWTPGEPSESLANNQLLHSDHHRRPARGSVRHRIGTLVRLGFAGSVGGPGLDVVDAGRGVPFVGPLAPSDHGASSESVASTQSPSSICTSTLVMPPRV